MVDLLKKFAVLTLAALVAGCAVTITSPANNSSVVTPFWLEETDTGNIAGHTVFLDGTNVTQVTQFGSTSSWQLTPRSRMMFIVPGQHQFTVIGDAPLGSTVSDTSAFTVTSSPFAYTCPAGYLHPFLGQCCENGVCDGTVFSNFGLAKYDSQECVQHQDEFCINQLAWGVCGNAGQFCGNNVPAGVPESLAVRFSTGGTVSRQLAHIQIPVSHRTGTNSYDISITADNAGKPGAIVEQFSAVSLRAWVSTPNAPMHFFSVTHPTLTAGANFWLVVAPRASDTIGSWNWAYGDTPTTSNFLANQTAAAGGVPSLGGPWIPAGGTRRPAFEIDVR